MSVLYAYIVTVYFASDKVLLKNFTTTTKRAFETQGLLDQSYQIVIFFGS